MSSKDARPATSVALCLSSFLLRNVFLLVRLTVESCAIRWPARSQLLRNVFLLVRLTVESYDVRWPVRSQKQSKLTTKIDRKSIPGDAMGHPKSTQNRSREPLWTPSGAQECPEGVSGASRERLGASPGRKGSAQGVTRGTLGRQEMRPGASRSAPRRPKSTPSRARERKNRVLVARPGCNAVSKRIFVDFCRFSVFSQSLRTLRSTAHASKNRGSAHRAASRVARAMLPQKATKIDPKIDPKSSKMASRGLSGALRGQLLSLEVGQSSDLGRLGATRATRRATRSDQVGRSGSVGVGRVGLACALARVPWR